MSDTVMDGGAGGQDDEDDDRENDNAPQPAPIPPAAAAATPICPQCGAEITGFISAYQLTTVIRPLTQR